MNDDDGSDRQCPADPQSPSSSISSSPQPNYDDRDRQTIRTIQLLIEKCLTFAMDREECIECLRRNAKLDPSVTRTVWDELEKSNPSFFAAYNNSSKRRKEQPPPMMRDNNLHSPPPSHPRASPPAHPHHSAGSSGWDTTAADHNADNENADKNE